MEPDVKELFDKAVELAGKGEKMWDSGILGIILYPNPSIHLEESAFFSAFGNRKDIQRKPFPFDENYEDAFFFLENGVRVHCLVDREVKE